MKPLSAGTVAGLLFTYALIQGTSAVDWDAKASYDATTSCAATNLGSLFLQASSGSCSAVTSCTNNAKTFCSSDSTTATTIADKFGAIPYLKVSKYSATGCSGLTSVTAYALTGLTDCHPVTNSAGTTKYFKATTINPLGPTTPTTAVKIEMFTNAACTNADSANDIPVLKTDLTSGSPVGCDTPNGGAGTTKYEISATYPVTVQAVPAFDGTLCTSDVALVSSTVPGTCTSDTTCSSASGSSTAGVICTSNTDYKADFATLFGTTPHVMVSKFSGSACTSTTMTSLKAYAADGKCHLVSSGKYYSGLVAGGGSTATITFYSNSDCSSQLTTTGNDPIVVGPTQLGLSAGSVSGCDGATQATHYEFSQSWPASKNALTVSDGGDCTKAVGFVSIAATSGTNNDCTADTDCASGAGAICTTNFNYDSALAAKFGSTPYVAISTFLQASCPWSALSTVKAYAADGKCHMIDTNTYYKVTAVAFGGGASNAKIVGYSDSACTTADTTLGIDFDVTKLLLTTTSGCATSGSASTQYKLSANWPKAMNVAGVGTYAVTTCAGAPSKLTFTDVVAASANCGVATTTCTAAKALADCSNSTSYKSYMDTAFGSVPYLIREAYSTAGCPSSSRGAITAYAADGTCYVDGADSFKVVASAGVISIKKWTADTDCAATTTTHTSTEVGSVSAVNLIANTCTSSAKYYMGGNWVFASNAVYEDSNCALTPTKYSLSLAPSCTTPTGGAACAATTSTTDTTKTGYNAPGCAKLNVNYFPVINKAFGMTTYVVQESYTGGSCNVLAGVTAYVADGACHLSGDATSSYNVTYDPAATATGAAVTIQLYANLDCSTTGAATPVTVAPSAISGKTCAADFTKTYVGGLGTKLTAVTAFSDNACKVPVQTVFTSPATTCTPTTTCASAGGGLYYKQACNATSTNFTKFTEDVYGGTRRLVTDIYEATDKNKCGSRQGIVAYVGDGACHATLDSTTFFKVTLGETNTAAATFSTFSDKACSKDEKALSIPAASLAAGSPCDATTSIKFSVGGTEPPTEAPATDAPTPAPTTAVSTGSGKSAAVSSFSVSIFGLLASVLGGLTILLN